MDDNTKKLVEEFLGTERELAEFRAMKRQLVNLLWDAELQDATSFELHNGKYHESISKTTVKVEAVRNIFGIMPNPEAIAIYKNAKEEADANAGNT